MQYYILDSLGEYDDEKYCHVEGLVEGVDDDQLALECGGSLSDIYPADPFEVTMELDEDSPKHIEKGDFVSTTDDYVMVSTKVVEELKKNNIKNVEFWPFTLMNHKGRIHSKDYNFVVTQPYDALHLELSEINRDENNTVIGVDKIVLDNRKLENAPDVFHINDICRMAFSEPLAKILQEKYTNFVFDKAEQA